PPGGSWTLGDRLPFGHQSRAEDLHGYLLLSYHIHMDGVIARGKRIAEGKFHVAGVPFERKMLVPDGGGSPDVVYGKDDKSQIKTPPRMVRHFDGSVNSQAADQGFALPINRHGDFGVKQVKLSFFYGCSAVVSDEHGELKWPRFIEPPCQV